MKIALKYFVSLTAYLGCKNETEENCDCQLAVTKEDDVQKIRIGRMLKKKPKNKQINFEIIDIVTQPRPSTVFQTRNWCF